MLWLTDMDYDSLVRFFSTISVRVFVQILLWFENDSLCFAAEYIVTTVRYMRSCLPCIMSTEGIGILLLEFDEDTTQMTT